jgi:ceramide glucosyltransferase
MRTAEPAGYASSFFMYSIVLSFLYLLLSSFSAPGAVVVGAALALRIAVHYAVRRELRVAEPARPWLVPLRDLLCFATWAASFLGRTVEWGGREFSVSPDGRMWASGRHGS